MISVAFDLRDPVRSGIARVARSLARSFAEQSRGRFRITLAGPRDKLEELGAPSWSPDVARIVDWPAGRYSLRAQVGWDRVRRETGEAVWYFPHWDVPWHTLPSRSIVTLHDLGHLRPEVTAWHRGLVARPWMRWAVMGATRVTTATDFTRREIIGRWPRVADRVHVIPHGVDPFFFTASPLPESLGKLIEDPFMLSVGNLKRHKNLEMGTEVLARLPGLRWIVVGEWFPDWRLVERRALALGVTDRLTYLGEQTDAVVNALYHKARCLFFPSRHEGFGLPILEALAAGTPVVGANSGATMETLGDAGWICHADSPSEFAAAVEAAVASAPAARAGRISRARQYSWENSASRLAANIEAIDANR